MMKKLIILAACFCLTGCAGFNPLAEVHQGNCVSRAFFNATTWTIATHRPVEIIDMGGHWQAKEVDGPYLCGSGWDTWACDYAEGNPIEGLSIQDAMQRFLEANPWAKK